MAGLQVCDAHEFTETHIITYESEPQENGPIRSNEASRFVEGRHGTWQNGRAVLGLAIHLHGSGRNHNGGEAH